MFNKRYSPVEGLYIHIPFCFHKCHYCDFYSVVDTPSVHSKDGDLPNRNDDRQSRFLSRLVEELQRQHHEFHLRPRTIFIGGGTPTLLRRELWENLLDALRVTGITADVKEFTVEANPETVSLPIIQTLVAGGVTRLSIGAQSFQQPLLETLERWHDPANVNHAVGIARKAGVTNINLDLIFAIPGQTFETLDADLDAALAMTPDHMSCYALTFEPDTALTSRLRSGQITRFNEEVEREMYVRVIDRLGASGYEHYEISNWAKPGKRCEHNMLYWRSDNWLALGPSGASHIDGHRWKNISQLGQYLSHTIVPTTDYEYLDQLSRVGEQLMMRLRLREGVSQEWFDAHIGIDDPRRDEIAGFIQEKLLEWTDTHLRLTHSGLFVADSVIAKLL